MDNSDFNDLIHFPVRSLRKYPTVLPTPQLVDAVGSLPCLDYFSEMNLLAKNSTGYNLSPLILLTQREKNAKSVFEQMAK